MRLSLTLLAIIALAAASGVSVFGVWLLVFGFRERHGIWSNGSGAVLRVVAAMLTWLGMSFVAWGQAGVPGGLGPGVPQGGLSGASPGPPPASCGVGALDLSTGCAQLVAFGVLF